MSSLLGLFDGKCSVFYTIRTTEEIIQSAGHRVKRVNTSRERELARYDPAGNLSRKNAQRVHVTLVPHPAPSCGER
jgi:hypothetical protein